jgi:hypothetical protein
LGADFSFSTLPERLFVQPGA